MLYVLGYEGGEGLQRRATGENDAQAKVGAKISPFNFYFLIIILSAEGGECVGLPLRAVSVSVTYV